MKRPTVTTEYGDMQVIEIHWANWNAEMQTVVTISELDPSTSMDEIVWEVTSQNDDSVDLVCATNRDWKAKLIFNKSN